jgi:hypothetical protein
MGNVVGEFMQVFVESAPKLSFRKPITKSSYLLRIRLFACLESTLILREVPLDKRLDLDEWSFNPTLDLQHRTKARRAYVTFSEVPDILKFLKRFLI